MSGIATAVVASAVIGGVVAKNSSDKAANAVKQATDSASTLTRQAALQARTESKQLFGGAQENANLGFQGALDVFGQSVPAQADVFQQGNVGAQQQILAGLPQIQNAILGNNVDLSALQPTNVSTDLGFFNQQLPEFVNPLQQQQQFAPAPTGIRLDNQRLENAMNLDGGNTRFDNVRTKRDIGQDSRFPFSQNRF